MSSVTSPSNSRELYELRKMLVRQMLLEQMVRYYYYQNMMYNISNLRFYTPIYSKVKFYQTPVYTSNINFYSIRRRGYVYKFYRSKYKNPNLKRLGFFMLSVFFEDASFLYHPDSYSGDMIILKSIVEEEYKIDIPSIINNESK